MIKINKEELKEMVLSEGKVMSMERKLKSLHPDISFNIPDDLSNELTVIKNVKLKLNMFKEMILIVSVAKNLIKTEYKWKYFGGGDNKHIVIYKLINNHWKVQK